MKEIDDDGCVTEWVYTGWYFGFFPVMLGYYEDDYVAVKPRFGIPYLFMLAWESMFFMFGNLMESLGADNINYQQPIYFPGRLDGEDLTDEDIEKLKEDF